MPKATIKALMLSLKNKLKKPHLPHISYDTLIDKACAFMSTWWNTLVVGLVIIIFFYYPIGGLLISHIDRTTDYEINENHPEQSSAVEMVSFLVNREVNDKIWTPNLPFFYPSYFLDNMPEFQLGIINSLSKFTSSFTKRISPSITQNEAPSKLQEAATLLRYPGTIWMFSTDNKLLLAPSANNQYRKARRLLVQYNQELSKGNQTFYKSPLDLSYILQKSRINLRKSSRALEEHIREESSAWIDTKADNVFYYAQGTTYAYYLLFKALGNDYKEIIVQHEQYQNWTILLKALEDASMIQPLTIRNGDLNSLTAPNHLSYLNMYIIKACTILNKISQNITVQLSVRK